MNLNKRLINISLVVCLSLMFCFVQGNDNETMLQELKIENALQEKLSTMIENKLLNESEYVLIVNATMRKKPLSTVSTSDNSSNTEATFTLPGFPLKNLQENKSDNTIVSSDSDYLLYFLEIVAYIDANKLTPIARIGALSSNFLHASMSNIHQFSSPKSIKSFFTQNHRGVRT